MKQDLMKIYHELLEKKNTMARAIPTYIRQQDFINGTYIINTPGHYILKEDIVFSPNKDNDYLPNMNDPKYNTLGYSLGFFAVISIPANGVYLDLNGHTIRASNEFAIQQRFFSIIELADAPFIPGEGPGNFSTGITAGQNIIIANGSLGLSSHHGIHGNMATNVLLDNLQIKDFEFVGIALNGGGNFVLNKIKIGPNRINVPVLATYSAARFAKLFTNMVLQRYQTTIDITDTQELKHLLSNLDNEMKKTFKEIKAGKIVSSELFRNETGLPDGNIYGICIKDKGFAVNDFVNNLQLISEGKTKTANVLLQYVEVADMHCKVDEVIALSGKNGIMAQVDVAGAVFQIAKLTKNGKYKPTNLSELQIKLATIANKYNLTLGKNNITLDTINWTKNGSDISTVLATGYKYKCGGDSMFHYNKGSIGYRFDALNNLYLYKCSIKNFKNTGNMGNDVFDGHYLKSHDQAKRQGYFGADNTGINISFCSNVILYKLNLSNLISPNGTAVGINILYNSQVSIVKTSLQAISSGHHHAKAINYYNKKVRCNGELPNKLLTAIGIRYYSDCVLSYDRLKIKDLGCGRRDGTKKILNDNGFP